MVNYQQSKIYKIVSNTSDDICYVGSTTKKYLCQRMDNHRNGYKCWKKGAKISTTTSFELFEKYGVENCRIELIEIFPCNSKDELFKKEGEHIRLLNCVNKNVAGRTRLEYQKEYRENNHDTILEYQKKWCEDNPEYQKKWKETNPECNNEYQKKWYSVNRDTKIQNLRKYREVNKEKIKEKYTCVCGSTIRKSDKTRHEKSLKHMNYCASVSAVP